MGWRMGMALEKTGAVKGTCREASGDMLPIMNCTGTPAEAELMPVDHLL